MQEPYIINILATKKSDEADGPTKKPFALRINATTMAVLEQWAAQEFRSVNGQIEYLLDKAIKERNKSAKN